MSCTLLRLVPSDSLTCVVVLISSGFFATEADPAPPPQDLLLEFGFQVRVKSAACGDFSPGAALSIGDDMIWAGMLTLPVVEPPDSGSGYTLVSEDPGPRGGGQGQCRQGSTDLTELCRKYIVGACFQAVLVFRERRISSPRT